MADVNTIDSRPGLAGYLNANVSTALRSFAVDYWPPHHADTVDRVPTMVITRHVAAGHGHAIVATPGRSYVDDFYFRVHVRPARMDIGNLVSAQMRQLEVWNAWPDQTITLTALQQDNTEGIVVSGQAPAPLPFAPLQVRDWSINIEQTGPGSIDALLRWIFDNGALAHVEVTGRRVTPWMVPADWANGVTETLAWLTDVQQASDGSQVREPLRQAPRRGWKFDAVAGADDRRILESALYDWAGRSWAIPVWSDVTWLSAPVAAGASSIAIDTRYLDFSPGGLAMLYHRAKATEVVEIDTVSDTALALKRPTVSAYGVGDRVYPCRMATLAEAQIVSRRSDDVMTASVSMQAVEPCDAEPVAPATTYLGLPVLDDAGDWSDDRDAGFARQLTVTDNSIGIPDVLDRSGKPWLTNPHAWVLAGRAERAAHRSLLYWLQGRAQALWIPTGAADLQLAADLAAGSTTMVVGWCGYTRHLRQQPGRRHLRIELGNGAVYYRRITASTESTDTEQLGLDTPLPMAVSPADVRLISYLVLSTLASDSVDIMHDTDSEGLARCSVAFVGVPAEEPT